MVSLDSLVVRGAEHAVSVERGRLDDVRGDLATLAGLSLGGLEYAAQVVAAELVEELTLLSDLLGAKAAAMELADSGFSTGGAYLMGQVADFAALLQASLADEIGSGGSPSEVREFYTQRAYEAAGIDPTEWNPQLGLDANAHIVESVYEYYADLYRSEPGSLWWAGMAAMIGPSFYGGFRDLESFADLADKAQVVARMMSAWPGSAQPAWVATDFAAGFTEEELRWYQQVLLGMQQEIFLDMAPAHEAYNHGGMLAIEALFAEDAYRDGAATVAAWQKIDDGRRTDDVELIRAGNRELLYREQRHIIRNDYDEMRGRRLTGEVVTYIMTAIGAPSVPGAKSYPELFPLDVDVSQWVGTPREVTVIPWVYSQSVPHAGGEVTVTVTTPLPDGNISQFDDRWALIEQDTLPVYVDLAEHHPDVILDVLDVPVGDRADDFSMGAQWEDLLMHFGTEWAVDLDVDWSTGW